MVEPQSENVLLPETCANMNGRYGNNLFDF